MNMDENYDYSTTQKENVWTVPNVLCMLRIGSSPVLGHLILNNNHTMALSILVFAALTDLADGLIARNVKGQMSKLGSFLDPLADKVLAMTLFTTLTYTQLIPVELTLLVVSRDIILLSVGFYIRYISLPKPRSVKQFMDASNSTAKLKPTMLSKVNTAIQFSTAVASLAAPVVPHIFTPLILQYFWYTTGLTTISSGISYAFAKDTFTLANKRNKK